MHLNVDLSLEVLMFISPHHLLFFFPPFLVKYALSFCVSSLISNTVLCLRFFIFTVGNFTD